MATYVEVTNDYKNADEETRKATFLLALANYISKQLKTK